MLNLPVCYTSTAFSRKPARPTAYLPSRRLFTLQRVPENTQLLQPRLINSPLLRPNSARLASLRRYGLAAQHGFNPRHLPRAELSTPRFALAYRMPSRTSCRTRCSLHVADARSLHVSCASGPLVSSSVSLVRWLRLLSSFFFTDSSQRPASFRR